MPADDHAVRGEKYRRQIRDIYGNLCHVWDGEGWIPAEIDIAAVVRAYDPPDAASGLPAQVLKKTLMPGGRGKGDADADYRGAIDALEAMRRAMPKPDPPPEAVALMSPDESDSDAR